MISTVSLSNGTRADFDVERLRTGKGQLVEVSMQEAMIYYMRTRIANGSNWGTQAAPRSGNGEGPMLNLYPCAPGGANDYVYLVVATQRMWEQLCVAMGRPELADDPRFKDVHGLIK